MIRLDIDQKGETSQPGFLRRQFMPSTSSAQRVFDVLFGVVAPILCFVFDPIVFRANFGLGLLPAYQSYAYLVSGIEISLLLICLLWGPQLQPRTRLLGGTLMAGALFSGVIGVILLPFSLIGLLLGIGIFGFIPFFTALVYWRNGKRALQLAGKHLSIRATIGTVALGCVLSLGAPAGLNLIASRLVSESMKAVLYGDPRSADMAVDQIKYLRFFARPEVDTLISAYTTETEPRRKNELKRRYARLTGEDIEVRVAILLD